jgi:hypothetical protein
MTLDNVGIRRVDGNLGRGQGENQPSVPGVDALKAEGVAEEAPVSVRGAAVEEKVDAVDHGRVVGMRGGGALSSRAGDAGTAAGAYN